jgi:hypothetical protein
MSGTDVSSVMFPVWDASAGKSGVVPKLGMRTLIKKGSNQEGLESGRLSYPSFDDRLILIMFKATLN